MSADLPVDRVSSGNLIQNGLCEISETEKVILSSMGRQLLMDMKLESKPMKKVKIKGDAAESLIDEMFASLN